MSRRKTITFAIILLIVVFVLATRHERVQRGDNDFALISKLDAGERCAIDCKKTIRTGG